MSDNWAADLQRSDLPDEPDHLLARIQRAEAKSS